MKKVIALSAVSLAFASSAMASSSYVTGNIQFHNETNPKATSTLEAGHTFDSGTTLLTEFDGIGLGEYTQNGEAVRGETSAVGVTLGVEQAFSINDNLWVAAGYHHLMRNGKAWQYRPLVKVGYNFDNGLYISNRTRLHYDAEDGATKNDLVTTRFDNAIGYQFVDQPLNLKYNNVYQRNDNRANTMDHELRATWTREGVQPYFELRSQGHGAKLANGDDAKVNTALVFGASYGF
ncbi:oligogalacturonate-specific porin KdgM family protein [Vibrio sp.]|uniref:oligogalacturonate-specific porin KdgM family protein n=1 Tax=Vibrio sp. TaxID=678 RepID=UPI003D0AB051